MQVLDPGKDKIKKICETLRDETIRPAQKQAEMIIQTAEKEARLIIEKGKKEAEALLSTARRKIEEEKSILAASLHLACKQALNALKGAVETTLLTQGIGKFVQSLQEDMARRLLEAVLLSLKEAGLSGRLLAYLPKHIASQDLASVILKAGAMEVNIVPVAYLQKGIKIALEDSHLTLDLSDDALKELIAAFIREDFRQLIFAPS